MSTFTYRCHVPGQRAAPAQCQHNGMCRFKIVSDLQECVCSKIEKGVSTTRLYQRDSKMPPKRKVRIDRDWFLARLRDRKLSMRQLSKDLCLDASAVSLILSGKRDVSPGEIKSLADRLYNIVFAAPGTDKMLENVAVAWCSPVLWIKPRR